jgi:C1A family cysteine protease
VRTDPDTEPDWSKQQEAPSSTGASLDDDSLGGEIGGEINAAAADVAADVASAAKDNEPLPKHYDWTLEKGVETPVMMQGSCGSCYAIATTDMINMRRRIASKGTETILASPQNLLSCSPFNQGCRGG